MKSENLKECLIKKLLEKDAVIGIIGLGFVGLPLSLCFAKSGYKVLGIDIDNKKVDLINSGKSYINHIKSQQIKEYVDKERLVATSDFNNANIADAIILCLPTPLGEYRDPDLQYIHSTMALLKDKLRKGL